MAHKDPEMGRYGQVNVNVNGYQRKAFEKTADHFKQSVAGLGYLWMMEPEHPLTIRTRTYFYQLLDERNAGIEKSFWSSFALSTNQNQ